MHPIAFLSLVLLTAVNGVDLEPPEIVELNTKGDPAALAEAQSNLDAAMAVWNGVGLTRYVFGFQRSCFCTFESVQPMLATVDTSSGTPVVSDVTARLTGEPVSDDVAQYAPSIESIFATIQGGIDQQAFSVAVTYNKDYGYPESVSIDYEQFMADEEYNMNLDYLGTLSAWTNANEKAKAAWDAKGLASYTYVYNRNGPQVIDVENGVVVSVDGNSVRGRVLALIEAPTIDDLFQEINDAIDASAFSVTVTYDEVSGYPTSTEIDYTENEVGDEVTFTAELYDVTTMESTCEYEDISSCAAGSNMVNVLDVKAGSNAASLPSGDGILFNIVTSTDSTTGNPTVSFQVNNPFDFGVDTYVQFEQPIEGTNAENVVCDGTMDKPSCDIGSEILTAHCLSHPEKPYTTVSVYFVSQNALFAEGGESEVYRCCEQTPETVGFPVVEYTLEVYCECPAVDEARKLLRGA